LIAVFPLAGGSKDVSGGKVAGIESLGQELRLRAFAYARRTQQDQPPGALAFGWNR
jgi:hypothetical protein